MVVAFSDSVASYVSGMTTETDYDVLDKLERLILEHIPQSIAETVSMLGVVILNVEAGGRTDGADVSALESIRSFLAQVA